MGKINMIRQEGGSRVLAITKVIPLDWKVVELSVVKTTENFVTLKVTKVK